MEDRHASPIGPIHHQEYQMSQLGDAFGRKRRLRSRCRKQYRYKCTVVHSRDGLVQSMLIDAELNSFISLQWRIERLKNGTYVIQNQYYNRHHANCILDSEYVTSVRDKVPVQWRIELEPNDRYKYGAK